LKKKMICWVLRLCLKWTKQNFRLSCSDSATTNEELCQGYVWMYVWEILKTALTLKNLQITAPNFKKVKCTTWNTAHNRLSCTNAATKLVIFLEHILKKMGSTENRCVVRPSVSYFSAAIAPRELKFST
jgi:hypothetical protein